ncbi:MAG: M20/M25/M40 family metallo-hydrolase [Anaerolineae bacterium]|nr:M20/M25/M40 family metallo-hydrolase [Anaerolineae bacterium]
MRQDLYLNPVELLQTLIRFDTTNPPGNEAECMGYLNTLLREAGIATTILARDDRRPNLIARLPGRGEATPLLMYGHVDVVTTKGQEWTHPPFAADIIDGSVWGRGALDMKSGIAMMVCAVLRAKAENLTLPGDVILAIVSDEEVDGEFGAKYLVEHHAGQFDGVRYAVGEGGGFSQHLAGRKFYPIMVGEKQVCSLRATLRGPGGHGSMPIRGGAMAKLANFLHILDRRRLPVHFTPVVRQMIEAIGETLPFPKRLAIRQLLNPRLTNWWLDRLGEQGRLLNALLHNTVSPTMVQGGYKLNVIPGEVTVELDGRLLPGFTPADMLHELKQVVGNEVSLEITRFDPGPGEPDMTHFNLLADILRQADPSGTPIPLVLAGVTDARYFARLGIQTYGFHPMDVPDGLLPTIHAANERIPVEAMQFGTEALYTLLRRFRG